MTRKHLWWVTASVIAAYVLAVLVGVALRHPFGEDASSYYQTYKDLLPLVIAIPAAYLAFGFQRRSSYLQALRSLWSQMVGAISAALTYTDTPSPTPEQYLQTLGRLSAAIEEVRGVFRNVPASGTRSGWYPFEPVKQIYQEIRDLGHGAEATEERRAAVRERVYEMWRLNREQLLAEFDRDTPTHHHAEYAPRGPRHGASEPRT